MIQCNTLCESNYNSSLSGSLPCSNNPSSNSGIPDSTLGLLLDWLDLLDPEMISACPALQQRMMFGREQQRDRSDGDDSRKPGSGQPYLLALLTHQSSWSSLQNCINTLLREESNQQQRLEQNKLVWS